ncbi:U2 small nuclear ribonucleoprotein auxiliary factor 35 kDa subunit-related protein 2 isoform X1 [Drosophila pseudoobscura]|uniref:U2 small nuclear ribonucleoprotein auxiliary factor 35 kDa subunit-related protein 2 isoform X1 n=1 Tax=Drosophila pseudoobscura pseudoobscura TaxID=46245 RepID=A0A6I8UKV9_DROPS|nr:U2 small nuclear ribonucleoprotein auxiliary factor 35 kDa subunit-related protein 2 isoform X1 [Drosophila pseudoobscura]
MRSRARRLIKKKQRQRRRQKHAKERDREEQEAEARRLEDPEYHKWLQKQSELENFQRLATERQQQEEEEAWLRREALAQRQFRLDAAKRRQEEEEVERLKDEEAKALTKRKEEQKKRRQERQTLAERAADEFESMMKSMDEYLHNAKLEKPPDHLLRLVETHPEERPCEFFTRTNSCRYGHSCTFNHRRPMLGRILLIRHFFSHSLLHDKKVHKEYASGDEGLEMTEHDLRSDYDEFFNDAVTELEKFGKIVNFRALRNTLEHLSGHVFVEYANEKCALRAFINLQGRYYASRRLNVEFSNLHTWRGAVCGLSLTRKCPKGNSCGYLHLFRNPNNLFNKDLEYTTTPRSVRNSGKSPMPKTPSWNDGDDDRARNWRWSESPELELENSKGLGNHIQTSRREHDLKSPRRKEHHSRSRNGSYRRTDWSSSRSNREYSSRRDRSSYKSNTDCHSSRSNRDSSPSPRIYGEKSPTSVRSHQELSFRSDHYRSRSPQFHQRSRK